MSVHRSRLSRLRSCSLALTLVASAGAGLHAQAPQGAPPTGRLLDSARVLIAKAYPVGDVEALHLAQALLDRALTVAPNDPWLLHYQGFAIYREASLRMGRDRDGVGPLLERADSVLDRASRVASLAETFALRSSVLGMMIGSNPIKGMTLGPHSGDQMERALAAGPNNPRVWLVRGIGAINTPAMFGGGLEKAEEYLKKSIALFTTDRPAAPAPGWGAYEAHIWLGQVYARQDRKDEARAEYQKALALEPNDMWTRMSLIPALDKKP